MSISILILPLYTNHITKRIVNHTGTLHQIITAGAVMVILVAIHTACSVFVDYHGHMMGAKMERDMRRDLFDHYQKLSFGFYDEHKTGQLMTYVTNDLFSISELYHHGPEDFVIGLLNLIGVLIIMASINLGLTLIIVLFLPPMALYAFYFNRKMNAALSDSKDRISDINAQVEDSLAGIRVVKSFTNEGIEQQKFAYANNRFIASRSAGYKSEAYFSAGMTAFTQLLMIAVIIFGGASIVAASLDISELLTFLLCVGILIEPIQRFVNIARLYSEGVTGFNRYMDIMDVEPDIQDAPGAIELVQARGDVVLKDVRFKYKADHDAILNNISLDIAHGEYIALVGPSGAGKTTLCSLIPRFYEIDAGAVLIDGIDIRSITLQSLRRNIGVVQQDVYLFAGTVLDNIRYGQPAASEHEIIAAAKKANAHNFIMELPDGYATDIGQRGVKLSGGQKQRLSIARVFLKNPPIIIFDEATSALDNESERAVQESLETLTDNRTTIVIAHRLSTVRNAQRIVVLTDNGIDEQDTHEELVARGGTYANLYNLQLNI
jgi:ATP-binding cassette, subfamily B, bacterial